MWLNVRNGTTDLPGRGLDVGEIVAGRDAGCDLVITDERASRRHTRLTALPDGRIRVEDLGSTNGTWVDGTRITEAVSVGVGGEIRIGRHHLRLTSLPQPAGPATVIGDESAAVGGAPAGGSPVGGAPGGGGPVGGSPGGGAPVGGSPVTGRPAGPSGGSGPLTPLTPLAPLTPLVPAADRGAPPPSGFPVGGAPPPSGPPVGGPPPPSGPPVGGSPPPSGPPVGGAPPPSVPPLGGPPPTGVPRRPPIGAALARPAAGSLGVPAPAAFRPGPLPGAAVPPGPPGAPPFGPPPSGPPASGLPMVGPPAVGLRPPAAGPSGPAPLGPPPAGPPPGPAGLLGPPGSGFAVPVGSTRGARRRWLFAGGGLVVVAIVVVIVLLATGVFSGSSTFGPAQLTARWGPSTLYVQVSVDGRPVESGSAWVLDAGRGLIVTNAHVVDGGNGYSVGQGSGRQTATLVGVSPCDDLAVLRIAKTTGLRSFQLATQASVQAGDTVTALGYPGNSASLPNLSTTTGVVSVAETQFDLPSLDTPRYPDLIETSAAINPGNSGGPLLDDRGRLIGVNSAGLTESGGRIVQNEGYAIGVDKVRAVIPRLAAGHSIGFAGFDFVFPTAKQDFTSLGLPVLPGGIIVPSALRGSAAYTAGIGRGRPVVITAIGGKRLNGTLESYCSAVAGLPAGHSTGFTVVNGTGRVATVQVPVG